MNMLSYFVERPDENIIQCDHIKSLQFIFPCNMTITEQSESSRIFGTGGKSFTVHFIGNKMMPYIAEKNCQ